MRNTIFRPFACALEATAKERRSGVRGIDVSNFLNSALALTLWIGSICSISTQAWRPYSHQRDSSALIMSAGSALLR